LGLLSVGAPYAARFRESRAAERPPVRPHRSFGVHHPAGV